MFAVAPLVELYGGASDFHKSRFAPTQQTHTNDITIHFRTAKEDGVIFATSNTANDGYIKAFLKEGHAIVAINTPGAGAVSMCSVLRSLFGFVTAVDVDRILVETVVSSKFFISRDRLDWNPGIIFSSCISQLLYCQVHSVSSSVAG